MHPADRFYLFRWAGDQNHTVGLDTFVLAPSKVTFGGTDLVNKPAAQSISCRTAARRGIKIVRTYADAGKSGLPCLRH